MIDIFPPYYLMVHRNLIKIDCLKKSDKTTPEIVFLLPTPLRDWFVMIFWLPGCPHISHNSNTRSDYARQVRSGGQTKTAKFSSIKSCNPAQIMGDGREIVLGMKLRLIRPVEDVSHFSFTLQWRTNQPCQQCVTVLRFDTCERNPLEVLIIIYVDCSQLSTNTPVCTV